MFSQYKGSLAHRFALAASLLAALTLALTMLASLWLASQQQDEANRALQQKEASHNQRILNNAIKAITSRLNEAANSTLLSNALVDSAGRQTYLTPYLNGMQAINGTPVSLLFTDFEGKEISSSNNTHFTLAQFAWLKKQLESGKGEATIFGEGKNAELLIGEMISYSRTSSPDGALVYKIALKDLQTLISAQLRWGKESKQDATAMLLPLEVIPKMAALNLHIAQIPAAPNSQGKNTQYVLIVLFTVALALVVLVFGLRLAPGLTRDLRELEQFSRSVVENGFAGQRANTQGSVEVAGLARSINHMLDTLHEQHAKLQADSEARYRLLVEGTNAISWEANLPDFQYRYVSPQGHTITGISQSLWEAPDFWLEHLHPDDSAQVQQKRQQSVQEKHHYQCEFRFRKLDGSYVWMEEIAAVLLDENGQPTSLRGILLDIDERKLAEHRLVVERSKVDRLKSDFVSTVSHELRTPLTSIRGSLGLVLGGVTGPLNAQTEKLLKIAHQNSERLVRLINDLLDIDKIVSGKMEFEWQWLELSTVVEQAIETNQAYAQNLGTQIVFTSGPIPAQVKIDINRLLQVMANLLSNAAKFSPQGSNVDVFMEKTGHTVRVSVRDHGTGISDEFRSKIFEKFSQADSSDTRAKGGTGLGLAISKVLVEQMGGSIGFHSEAGKGATFYFELPL